MIGIKEAARILGVSETTIRRWVREGILPYYQFRGKGGKVLFDEKELEAFKASRRGPGLPERA